MEKDMKKLEEYIKNHENVIKKKKTKDSTFWGRLVLKLESFEFHTIACIYFMSILTIMTIFFSVGYIDLGFSIFIGGGFLFALFAPPLLDVLSEHNKMGEEEKIQALQNIKNLSEIEKYKDQALELSEIIDKPLPRKWWNGLRGLIGEAIKNDNLEKLKNNGDRETLMNTIKNNCHNEKTKTGESIVLRKETVFEDRI